LIEDWCLRYAHTRYGCLDRAAGITRALGPGCAGRSGMSQSPRGSAPRTARVHLVRPGIAPGARPISAPARFTIQRLQSPTCPISGCHAWRLCLTLPVAVAGVGLVHADRSQPRAGPDSHARQAVGLGPVSGDRSPLACRGRPARRRGTSCCDVSASTERRTSGAVDLDARQAEKRKGGDGHGLVV